MTEYATDYGQVEVDATMAKHWAECIRVLAKEILLLREQLHATRMTIVHTVGGTVEGRPTSTINYLQRLRELVEIEHRSRRRTEK